MGQPGDAAVQKDASATFMSRRDNRKQPGSLLPGSGFHI